MRHNILLVDDDSAVRLSMKAFLENEGFSVKAVASGDEALAFVRQKLITFSLALVDYHLVESSGAEVISDIRKIDTDIYLVGFSGDDSVETHNSSLDSGALTFVSKDINNQKLLGLLHRICREVERKSKPLNSSSPTANQRLIHSVGLIGCSENLAGVARMILKVGPTSESVLLRGENGTGKEMVARAIHENSHRSRGPFIAVNCASLPSELIESELFGHEKGAFTGASSARIGKFQAANNGTLFLDEIGDMPLALQTSLLRVLQEREVTPVGSNTSKKVNVRVISATNAPLEELVTQGRFRQDLYFRLNVIPIHIDPLRKRREDVSLLIQHFLSGINREQNVEKTILDFVVQKLIEMDWPGNVRELGNAIKRLHALSEGTVIGEEALQFLTIPSGKIDSLVEPADFDSLKARNMRVEREFLRKTILAAGSISAAAVKLDMSRSTLRDRMRALGLVNPFSKMRENL